MADRLSLAPLARAGADLGHGARRAERHFLDFVVNGQSLWQAVAKRTDTVTVLCAEFTPAETVKAVNRLLLTEPAQVPNDRRCIYVCPECGDVGCGAITAAVTKEGDSIVWKEFGHENNYGPEVHLEKYAHVGPFVFDAVEYERTLREGLDRLRTMRA